MKKFIIVLALITLNFFKLEGETLQDMLKEYKNHPEDFQLCNKIGIEYTKQNNYNLAKNYFVKSVILNNNYYKGYYNLGVIYYKKGDYKNAIINFKRAISINKKDASLNLALINTLLLLKKYNEIKDILPEIIKIFPDNIKILNSIGIYYILINDFNKAYDYFTRALNINNDYKVLNNIAITKYFLKDKDTAIKYLRSIKDNYKIINSNLNILGGKVK